MGFGAHGGVEAHMFPLVPENFGEHFILAH